MKKVEVNDYPVKDKIIHGAILGISAYMMMAGFEHGCRVFEDVVPSAVDKVHMAGLVADMAKEESKKKKKKKKVK
jgi:hypothetical protein